MTRKESEAVPEGIGPPRQKIGPDQPTLADLYRLLKEGFERERKENESLLDKMDVLSRKMDEISEYRISRSMGERLTRLERDARQPRLAMEADGLANTKTRKRTEGAATAVQAMHGDSCSANRLDPNPMCSTSFGDDCTGPPAPPCSGENALVDNGATAPKLCLPPLEMRTTTAAGGLPPIGETSTATKITFNQPSL